MRCIHGDRQIVENPQARVFCVPRGERAARPLRLRRSGEEHGRAARAPLEVPAAGLKVKGLKVKGLKVESRRRANVEQTFDF